MTSQIVQKCGILIVLFIIATTAVFAQSNTTPPPMFWDVNNGDNVISGDVFAEPYTWHYIHTGQLNIEHAWVINKATSSSQGSWEHNIQINDLHNYWFVTNNTGFSFNQNTYVHIDNSWAWFGSSVTTDGFWMTKFEDHTNQNKI